MDVGNLVVGGLIGGVITFLVAWYYHVQQTKAQREVIEDLKNTLDVEQVCLVKQFDMAHKLAVELRKHGWARPAAIVAVSPGGEMLAQWLSSGLLGTEEQPIPVYTIRVHVEPDIQHGVMLSKSGSQQVDATSLPDFEHLRADAKVLLVTDVVRKGRRLQAAYRCLLDNPRFSGGNHLRLAALAWWKDSEFNPENRCHYAQMTDKPLSFGWRNKPTPQNTKCWDLCP